MNSFAGKSTGGKGPVKAETEPMGLGRYAAVDRTEGVIQNLFVDNVRKFSGSDELVAFTKQVIDIVGSSTERLTVLGELGRGKCGRVDEVQLVDFPGGSYALKTICEVGRALKQCMFKYVCVCRELSAFACDGETVYSCTRCTVVHSLFLLCVMRNYTGENSMSPKYFGYLVKFICCRAYSCI